MLIMLFSLSPVVSSVFVKHIILSTLLWNVLNLYFSQDVAECVTATIVPTQNTLSFRDRMISTYSMRVSQFPQEETGYSAWDFRAQEQIAILPELRNMRTWAPRCQSNWLLSVVRTLLIWLSDFHRNMLPMASQIAIRLLQN